MIKNKSDGDNLRENALIEHDNHRKFIAFANESAVKTGESAVKTVLIMNGGAVVATLTFFAALVDKSAFKATKMENLADGLLWFTLGVAFASIATGAAYFTNLFIALGAGSQELRWEWPFIKFTEKTNRYNCISEFFRVVAVLATCGGILTFIIGIVSLRAIIAKIVV